MDIQAIKTTLQQTKNSEIFEKLKTLNDADIVRCITYILDSEEEQRIVQSDPVYKENVLEAAQFVYTRYLSSRKEERQPFQHKTKKKPLFSTQSLEVMYNLAA